MSNALPTGIEPATPDEPSAPARIYSLDLIRGVAVLGILAANMTVFAMSGIGYRIPTYSQFAGTAENAFWFFNYVFVDGKMRGLFAFLFGAGVMLFLDHARARGARAWWLQLRRLFWLAVFGTLHAVFLFDGDILFDYAVIGMAVALILSIPRVKDWMLLTIAALVFMVDAFGAYGYFGPMADAERAVIAGNADSVPGVEKYLEEKRSFEKEQSEEGALARDGSYLEITRERWDDKKPIERAVGAYLYYSKIYIALMLMGAVFYRRGFFDGAWPRRPLLLWSLAGIAVSTAISLAIAVHLWGAGFPPATTMFWSYVFATLHRQPMVLGLAGVLVLAAPALLKTGLGERLSAAGRMAFTNYIAMSVIFPPIFFGWGLGLVDMVPRWAMYVFVFVGWGLMLAWSKPWLERYRFGPLEWAWRCLTYWKLFPIRR